MPNKLGGQLLGHLQRIRVVARWFDGKMPPYRGGVPFSLLPAFHRLPGSALGRFVVGELCQAYHRSPMIHPLPTERGTIMDHSKPGPHSPASPAEVPPANP